MTKGAPFYSDRSRYYVQTNNPTEQMLKKHAAVAVQYLKTHGVSDQLLKDSAIGSWLESCGGDAMTNCAAALGKDFTVTCPGGFQPQTDEIVAGYLNDPRNYTKFLAARPDLDPNLPATPPGNRIPQYFPLAAREVFGIAGKYTELPVSTLEKPMYDYLWSAVMNELLSEHPVQLCLINPGHYIAAVAFDMDADEIIINDSWPGRFTDGLGGFNRRLPKSEVTNLRNFIVAYQEA